VDIKRVIDAAVRKRMARGTVSHIRATMHRIFDKAWREETIPENPVAKVKLPALRRVKKKRVILADDEVMKLWGCEDASLEIRLMGLVARCEGGMRTRDVTAWNWTMVDCVGFSSCIVPRTKTGKPQRLDIPSVLQVPLRRWWVSKRSPVAGPVFPVTGGNRKGEARLPRGVSFGERLRRALHVAGVRRHTCAHPNVRPTAGAPGAHSCRGAAGRRRVICHSRGGRRQIPE